MKKYISIYLLSLLDLIFTIYEGGAAVELNPFGIFLFSSDLVIFYKAVIVGISLIVLYKLKEYKLAKILTDITLIVFIGLICYHIYGIGYVHYITYLK